MSKKTNFPLSRTPAPKADKIHGSAINPKGSASSSTQSGKIMLSKATEDTLKQKLNAFKEKYGGKKNVSLSDVKKVYRRGSGAYSSTHRPTITGGKPNSRAAWSYARVNAFLKKAAGEKSKKSYVQDDDLLKEGGDVSKHLAPNGKPSKLTPEQWHLVRTPAFKSWFGDWENDPENASKVVDDNGEPLVVYHGTNKEFWQFLHEKKGTNTTDDNTKFGFFFSKYIDEAKVYMREAIWKDTPDKFDELFGARIIPVFLSMKNPLNVEYAASTNTKKISTLLSSKNDGIWDERGDFIVFEPNQIKLADGTNTTFDSGNPDIRYALGGNTKTMLKPTKTVEQIASEFGVPKYYVERQLKTGIEVELEHTEDKELAEKIALHHLAETPEYYKKLSKMESQIEYKKGGKTDRVPSTDPSTWNAAYKVGDRVRIRVDFSNMDTNKIYTIKGYQDALGDYNEVGGSGVQRPENPSGRLYFLTDGGGSWEGKDLEPADQTATTDPAPKPADAKPSLISVVNEGNDYGFTTPTGEKTRLTYLQQVLVRTKGFKDFFGDWEAAAKAFLADGRKDFMQHYKNVSKVLDYNTLEPKVVYHGTRAEDEFFRFDVTKEKGVGRPYGYFAVNRQYSDRFTQFSQRTSRETKPLLYTCFLNVRNPFMANASDYWQKNRDAEGWLTTITGTMTWDKYKTIEKNDITKPLADAIQSQIGKYLEQTFESDKKPFWLNMAKDIEKDFKFFLMAYGYDGIIYGEEIGTPYDPDDPSQYTEAVTIFDSKQVKLADGRNLNFNPLIDDIRYKSGGEIEQPRKQVEDGHELLESNPYGIMDKKAKLGMLINGKKYAEGGKIVHDGGSTNNGKKGGYFEGRSHADGGIKAINVDTGQLLEVEGEEVIITKGAVNDDTKREFEGEMLTNREILSRINQSGGGVAFEDGGEVRGHVCGCTGKKYKYGGEMLEDFNIIRNMNKPVKFVDDMLQSPKRFADFLVEKMK